MPLMSAWTTTAWAEAPSFRSFRLPKIQLTSAEDGDVEGQVGGCGAGRVVDQDADHVGAETGGRDRGDLAERGFTREGHLDRAVDDFLFEGDQVGAFGQPPAFFHATAVGGGPVGRDGRPERGRVEPRFAR